LIVFVAGMYIAGRKLEGDVKTASAWLGGHPEGCRL
jgi:hypothetical protein